MTIGEKLTESKNALDALLIYANETTGAGDINLGEAVRTLVDGYGQGGTDVTPFTKTDTGSFSFPVNTNLFSKGGFVINHKLGVPPKAIYVFDMSTNLTDVIVANQFVFAIYSKPHEE